MATWAFALVFTLVLASFGVASADDFCADLWRRMPEEPRREFAASADKRAASKAPPSKRGPLLACLAARRPKLIESLDRACEAQSAAPNDLARILRDSLTGCLQSTGLGSLEPREQGTHP